MKANSKFRSLKDNDYGVLGYFIAFILAATMMVFLYAVAIPFLINFSTDMYAAGDDIIVDSIDNLAGISNATIKARITNNLNNAQAATEDNINNLAFFYQYSWAIIIIVIMFSIYMLARKVVETGQTNNFGVV